MRTWLRSKVTLLFMMLAVLIAVPGAAALAQDTGTPAAPTIQSDKADYAPGELVTLTGGGWQPGEAVHINVNDTYGASWARNVDVTADASGNITDSFNLPDWFVSDYDVTATGTQSGTATTTFTDSNPTSLTVGSPTSVTVTQGSTATYGNVTVGFTGNSTPCTVTLGASTEPAVTTGPAALRHPADTGLPTGANGATANFTPSSLTGVGGESKSTTSFTVSTMNSTPTGTYTFHVKGTRGATGCQGSDPVSTTGGGAADQTLTLIVTPGNQAPATTVPTFTPASPKTNDILQASTTTSDADNNNVSVAWVWKVTRGGNTCQVKTDTSAAAAPGERTSSLDLSQSYTTSNCTGASPPASINPNKGDTVVVEATPNDDTVNGTMRSNNVAIADSAPVANNDNYNVNEDDTLDVPDPGVLGNDIDADNDTLFVASPRPVSSPTNGSLHLHPTGQFDYTPEANFHGIDTFTYKAEDGTAESNVATVTITVASVNDPPTTPGAITTNEALNNDGTFELNWADSEDVDGDHITYTLEKRDADDANWSEVTSGLTTSDYTFGSGNALGEGTWDFRVKAVDSPAGSESDFSTAENLVKVDKSAPNAPTLSFATTDQSFKATVSGVDWYKDSAKIDVAANGDPALADTSDGSGVDAASLLPNPFSVTQNGTSTASRKVKDNATNESAAGTLAVHVDAANPTVDPCPTTAPFILGSGGGTQNVTITASDGESGVDNAASTLSGTVNTSTVGEKTVTFTAKDNVGHSSAPRQCSYSVIFNWSGFFSPVDNNGTYNTVKAGSAIPTKFSLAGNQGLSILAAGFPTSQKVTCNAGAPQDTIEETVTAGNSSLSYDSSLNQYNYVWKTDKAWAGTCRVFSMKLIDGTTHTALFNFTK